MNFEDFLISIPKIVNISLPGQDAQLKMAPPFREALFKTIKTEPKTAKKAAVMVLFYPNLNQETHFVLILRNTYKGVHSAQIGFPGGKVEIEDCSLAQTALRETFEEIGIPPCNIELIKPFTEIYVPPSHFMVYPFLGICKCTPTFNKQDAEVNAIIEVPLRALLNSKNVSEQVVRNSMESTVKVPVFTLQNQVVWGATAMMLNEIKEVLKSAIAL